MPRNPKGKNPNKAKTITSWLRSDIRFELIEAGLRAKLNQDLRDNIEVAMAFAIEGERERLFGISPKEICKFMNDVSNRASSLADSISPSLDTGQPTRPLRILRTAAARDKYQLDLPTLAVSLRKLARMTNAEANRPGKLPKPGHPESNEHWTGLVLALAAIYESVHGRWPALGRTAITKEPKGIFYDFTMAVFAEIPTEPKRITPGGSAMAQVIKRALEVGRALRT